jgi:hypothetical protein
MMKAVKGIVGFRPFLALVGEEKKDQHSRSEVTEAHVTSPRVCCTKLPKPSNYVAQ